MSESLISTKSVVQTPSILVKIGNYQFGTYSKQNGNTKYPNYIQSLEITKINGQVNQYTLVLNYAITEYNDPNYFEKVFSSVALTRRIEFTYGDMSLPNFMYRNEVAMITKVRSNFSTDSARITYTVSAVSQGSLAGTGSYSFEARKNVKPSTVIYEILSKNTTYGLQDLFTGMRDIGLCKQKGLIPTTDIAVDLDMKPKTTILEYLQYLVDNMKSQEDLGQSIKNTFYVLQFNDDTTDDLGGSYFKIVEVNGSIEHPEAYQIDIGYPNQATVFDFNVDNDENYAIYYDYQTKLHPQEYVTKLEPTGEYVDVYDPIFNTNKYNQMKEADKSWWTKVTSYPIKASIKVAGLLRPAILMTYLRLNVLFYGRKHINSGLYMITKQVDRVDGSGFTTTLNLVKLSGDDSESII